jgi:hypothetical protein
MRKLTILAAMLALVAVVAVPAALAQGRGFDNQDFQNRFGAFFGNDFFNNFDDNGFDDNGFDDNRFDNNRFDNNRFDNNPVGISQEFSQETDPTGDINLNSEIVNTGDNSNQCAAPMQFGNTGNLQNQQGFLQYGSNADDIEFSGSQFVFAPQQGVQCDQAVQQSAAASSNNWGY